MRSVVWQSRVLAMALIFAAGGFCVGVSRSLDAPAPQVAARLVGTGALVFTNPVVASYTNEYDLGDATFGSAIARYVNAAGGLKPYRFTSEGPNSLANILAGYHSTMQLGIAGVLAGSLPGRLVDPVTRTPLPFPLHTVTGAEGLRFAVTVTDAEGTTLTKTASGMFNLALFPDGGAFRFAMDTLPTARLGANYLTAVDTIGGNGAKTYSIVSVAGAASSQDDLGIYCTPDGTITGRPLRQGTFTVTIRCIDSKLQIASARNPGFGQDQAFTFVVAPETVTSSDLTTLQLGVRGSFQTDRRDSLRYKGIVNALGQDNFSLVNSDFSFRVSGVIPVNKQIQPLTVTGRLNEKGQFSTVLADQSLVKVRVNAKKGTVDLTIAKGTFGDALAVSTLKDGPNNRRGVEVAIGDAVASSEVLDLVGKLSSSRYSLDYKLGSKGVNAAGAFQITSVKGKDQTTLSGLAGDSWLVNFIAAPRSGVVDPAGLKQGFDGVTGATVRIGGNFVEPLSSAQIKSTAGGVKFSGGATGVKILTLSTKKFTGRLQTLSIAANKTGIPLARDAARMGTVFFPLGLDLVRGTTGAPFTGEHARRIFGYSTQYKDQPPTR